MKACFHGGAFWNAVPLTDAGARSAAINADVLDAWFPPAPAVVEALADEWLFRTSPPTHAEEMERAIASAFRLPSQAVLAGPGSSALLFLGFTRWLTSGSRVLLIEPTYGEYAHICEEVIRCQVDRFPIELGKPFDLRKWSAQAEAYDLVVFVNPNNPSGHLVSTLELLTALPASPRVWLDEAYLAYAGEPSAAPHVLHRPNLTVVRSFSKSHALSGLRAAALFAHPDVLGTLRPFAPPWWVSLPAQVATVVALRDPKYYEACYAETHRLRRAFAACLPLHTTQSPANWLLAGVRDDGPTAEEVVRRCAARGVFLRDAGRTASTMGSRTLRIAVKQNFREVSTAVANAVSQEFAAS